MRQTDMDMLSRKLRAASSIRKAVSLREVIGARAASNRTGSLRGLPCHNFTNREESLMSLRQLARFAAVLALMSASSFLRAQVILRGPAEGGAPGSGPLIISAAPSAMGSQRRLLERGDVQNHLRLTVRQKKELGLAPLPPGGKARSKPGEAKAAPLRIEVDVKSSPEERQQSLQELSERVRAQVEASHSASEAKIKEVLTPEQLKRLAELDLQFRGPLALGEPKVVEEVKLAAEKRAPIAALAQEARRKMAEATVDALKEGRNLQQERKNRLSPLRKKTDKAKGEASEKILAMLSPEEMARWEAAQGKPFLFRTDL